MNLPMISESGNLEKVAGFQLRAEHVATFTAYMNLLNVKEVSFVTGHTVRMINKWMRSDWWKELEQLQMEDAFRQSSLKVARLTEEHVLPFLEKAISNTDDLTDVEVRHLNVKNNVAKLVLQLGAKPMLGSGGASGGGTKVVINNNNQTTNNTLNVDRLKALSVEEKHRIAAGGALPTDIIIEEEK